MSRLVVACPECTHGDSWTRVPVKKAAIKINPDHALHNVRFATLQGPKTLQMAWKAISAATTPIQAVSKYTSSRDGPNLATITTMATRKLQRAPTHSHASKNGNSRAYVTTIGFQPSWPSPADKVKFL
jgi:hypothetical protein